MPKQRRSLSTFAVVAVVLGSLLGVAGSSQAATGVLYSTKPIQGLAIVDVLRNVPVRDVANNVVGPQTGTIVSYSAYDIVGAPAFEYVQLTALNFGGVSGEVGETAGQFLLMTIAGLDITDLVITLIGSLP